MVELYGEARLGLSPAGQRKAPTTREARREAAAPAGPSLTAQAVRHPKGDAKPQNRLRGLKGGCGVKLSLQLQGEEWSMALIKASFSSATFALVFIIASSASGAPSISQMDQQALIKLANVANSVCAPPSTSGYNVGGQVSVEVKGVIPKLLAKLLEVSIGGGLKAGGSRYENVLQKDLAGAQADSRRCAENVFTHLFDAFTLTDLKTLQQLRRPSQPKIIYRTLVSQHLAMDATNTSATLELKAPTQSSINSVNNSGTITLEAAREHREKYLTMLQNIYSKGENILWRVRNSRPNDEMVKGMVADFVPWVNSSYSEILSQMTPAAAQSFMNVNPPSGSVTFTPPLNPPLSEGWDNSFKVMWCELPEYLENVKYLMDHDAMDPQNAGSVR